MLGTLSQEQIDQVLRSEVVGRLGLHADGRTYVVPITYAYDGAHIYGHSAVGMKIRMMRENPHVCFEVDHMDNLANWRSVIAWGVFEELHGDEATQAMRFLVDHLSPMMTSETSQPSHGTTDSGGHRAETAGHEAVIYRVTLLEKTGRFEKR
jgi:nitroimidazol reductase NimA-like FMN-containing flavoprotein (pyridoxamine 5'-phosphate oxidase superfamily)